MNFRKDKQMAKLDENGVTTYMPLPKKEYGKKQEGSNNSQEASTNSQAYQDYETYKGISEDYIKQYLNRDKFDYDVNTDAMYSMYRDQYLKQAQQAQRDATAQAAGLTGGYGSTYASAMGQNAYSTEMDKLDARAAELYDNAYQRYQQEGEKLLTDSQLYSGLAQQRYQESDEYKAEVAEAERKEVIKGLESKLANNAEIKAAHGYSMEKGEKTGYKGIANAIDLEKDIIKNIGSYTEEAFVDELYERLATVTIGGTPMTEEEMVVYVDWVKDSYKPTFKKEQE